MAHQGDTSVTRHIHQQIVAHGADSPLAQSTGTNWVRLTTFAFFLLVRLEVHGWHVVGDDGRALSHVSDNIG